MYNKKKKVLVWLMGILAFAGGCIGIGLHLASSKASASNTVYPVQEFRIGIGNTDRNINITGFSSGSNLNSYPTNGEQNEKWYLNYISSGIYEIVNSKTGYIITNTNNTATISSDSNGANQRWKIVGVDKDKEGQYLYYKIVSNADSNKALTLDTASNTIKVSTYSGSTYQKFKLNCDGLEGFAANCKVTSGEKAGTIGGLLGNTVYVSTVSELKSAMDSTEPLTVVVTGNIDCSSAGYLRIRDNKTLVGSYSKRTISDCMIRTNNEYGNEGDEPSDNIIIRNIDFVAAKNEDKILVQIWSSRNIWIDHCDFTSKLTRNKDEVGKFIWINTPYDNYMDSKDLDRSPDFITISYNTFTNRYWTVAYGTQNGETSRCRTSVMYNIWDQCVRRCPQIGNGYGHIYNNVFIGNNSGNDSGTAQIIAGEGSTIFSENCLFKAVSGKEVVVDGNAKYRESGNYTASSTSATPTAYSFKSSYTKTSWNPATENYGYELIATTGNSNYNVESFCNSYSGSFGSYAQIKYITDSGVSKYVKTKYSSPILKSISVGSNSNSSSTQDTSSTTSMDTSKKYMIKNVNSGLYLDVEGGKAEEGTNVQQWGASGAASYNTWTLKHATGDYYYIYSCVGDGKTYMLDVENGSKANGTNIQIAKKNGWSTQFFKFVDNGDGSYTITTRATKDASCIEIVNGATGAGSNVQQYQLNGYNCQKWILEAVE